MGQARVNEPKDSKYVKYLLLWGFRWCNKHQRFEKTCKNPKEVLDAVKGNFPEIRTEERV